MEISLENLYVDIGALRVKQDCALAVPGGIRHLSFAPGNLKSYFLLMNYMLGTLDFTGSEHWALFNFS